VFLSSPWRSGSTRMPPLVRFRPSLGPTPDDLAFVFPFLATPAPLLGFSAVRRIRSAGIHIPPEVPPSRLGSGFRVLSPSCRFTPPAALQVYFAPQTPFGFSLQGISSREGAGAHRLPPCRPAVIPTIHSPRDA